MYEVILSSDAADFYASADQPLERKLARCFRQLEIDPRRGHNIKRLTGEWSGYLRYRVGEWRVLFRIDDDFHRVYVAAVGHRREVYE